MVLTSPFSSIKGYVVTKPPLVLFTLCLIVFAVTTFTFAYYMEHNDRHPNTDAQRDWESFLTYLSKLELCAVGNHSAATHNNNTSNVIEMVTIALLVDVNINKLGNMTHATGVLFTDGWSRECPQSVPVNNIQVSFTVPNNRSANTSTEVCVSVTGPKDLLEIAATDKQCVHNARGNHNILGFVTNKNREMELCAEGSTFTMSYKATDDEELLLTVKDRTIINLHLLHTSYFLLVMAITLICYAMIKGKPVYKHQLLDASPTQT